MHKFRLFAEMTEAAWVGIGAVVGAIITALGSFIARMFSLGQEAKNGAIVNLEGMVKDLRSEMDKMRADHERHVKELRDDYNAQLVASHDAHEKCRTENVTLAVKQAQMDAQLHAYTQVAADSQKDRDRLHAELDELRRLLLPKTGGTT